MRSARTGAVIVGIALVAAGTPAAVAAQPAPAAPGTVARAATDRVDRTMGNGLGRLVAGTDRPAARGAAPSGLRIDQDALTIRDAQGRVLVQLTPRAGVDRTTFRAAAQKAGLVVTATDSGQGTLEGYASTSAVKALAKLAGTGTIAQALRPRTNVGSTTSQGVPFERVDRVQRAGVDGAGITIGALSDSYDTATTTDPRRPPDGPRGGRRPHRRPARSRQPAQLPAGRRHRGHPRGRRRRGPRHASDRARRRPRRQALLRDGVHRHRGLRRQHPPARRPGRAVQGRRHRRRRQLLRRTVLLRGPDRRRRRRRGRRSVSRTSRRSATPATRAPGTPGSGSCRRRPACAARTSTSAPWTPRSTTAACRT